jgi:hypothetical protein
MNLRFYFLPAILLLMNSGCGSDDDGANGAAEEDPGEHACEVVGDTGIRVAAAAVPDEGEELEPAETPYTIELIDGAPGYVTLHGGEDALLFVEARNVVTGLFHEDDLDTDLLEVGTPNEFCEADIPEHFDLELEESGHYHLQLGPAAIDEVWVLYIGTEGHAHE